MEYFALLTGILSIITFVLDLKGIFPAYQKYILNIAVFLLGLTVGIIISLGSSLQITLPPTISPREIVGIILFGGSGMLAALLMLISVFIDDTERRKVAMQSASGVSVFLIFLLMFFLSSFFPS